MRTNGFRQLVFTLAILGSLGGCASIISGRRADVTFETYPANAQVTIRDDRGRPVSTFNTPGVATLKRHGKLFLPARYMATISAPGYQTAQVPIGSTLNPWILGNIAIGGIPGLVIDSATGAAWKPKRAEIHQELVALDGPEFMPVYSDAEGSSQVEADVEPITADGSSSPGASPPMRR
jgi:uncharacterized protein YceK